MADLEAQQAGVDKSARRSMANINKRNAARNFDNALKNVSARPGEVTRTAQSGDDMFARRSTRPMTYWATNRGKSSSEAGTACCDICMAVHGECEWLPLRIGQLQGCAREQMLLPPGDENWQGCCGMLELVFLCGSCLAADRLESCIGLAF